MNKYTKILIVLIALFGVYGYFDAQKVGANPPTFVRCQTSPSSTTTLAYMTPGTATTTLSCDSGVGFGLDNAYLAIQLTATTSPLAASSTISFRVESSQDNIDWYPQSVFLSANATSTQITGDAELNTWIPAATSTLTGFPGSGSASRLHNSLPVQTPTRYTRVIFYNPVGRGGGNYGLWSELVGKRQTF